MEVRTAQAEISADGTVLITTSSQAPYTVRKMLSEVFMIPAGKIQIKVPFVGGGFGGKAPVFLEILALLASLSLGGRPVRLTIPREQDMASAPSRIGLEADIKIGATKDGVFTGAEMTYLLDSGAYTDITPYMTKATQSTARVPTELTISHATPFASTQTTPTPHPTGALPMSPLLSALSAL